MTDYVLCSIFSICALMPLLQVWKEPRRTLQLPCWIAATALVYLLPQFIALSIQSAPEAPLAFMRARSPSPDTLRILLLLGILTLVAVFTGYRVQSKQLINALDRLALRPGNRLYYTGILCLVLSFTANILLWFASSGDVHTHAQPELLRNLAFPALAILLWRYCKRPDRTAFIFLLLAAITPISLILTFAKREVAIRLFFTVVAGLFFWKGIRPTRRHIVAFGLPLLLFLALAGAYRSCMTGNSCRFSLRDLAPMLVAPFHPEQTLELREAGHLIEYTRENQAYEFGRGYLDHAVHALLPAALIGQHNKEALLSPAFKGNYQAYRNWSPTDSSGIAWSGLGDAFLQFSYAGFLVFFVIAVCLRSIWHSATRKNNLTAQFLYILLLPSAVRALLHGSYVFTTELIYWATCLALAFLLAGKKQRQNSRAS